MVDLIALMNQPQRDQALLGRVDIVVTERCNDDATGTTRWLLDASTCK
ncbi:hypothetical protein WME79_41145 [Sorangium sp. So ce726]